MSAIVAKHELKLSIKKEGFSHQPYLEELAWFSCLFGPLNHYDNSPSVIDTQRRSLPASPWGNRQTLARATGTSQQGETWRLGQLALLGNFISRNYCQCLYSSKSSALVSSCCAAFLQLQLPAALWSTFPRAHPLPLVNLVMEKSLSKPLSLFLAAIWSTPIFPPTQIQSETTNRGRVITADCIF